MYITRKGNVTTHERLYERFQNLMEIMWRCCESEGNAVTVKNSRIQLCLRLGYVYTSIIQRPGRKEEQLEEMGRNTKTVLQGWYVKKKPKKKKKMRMEDYYYIIL